ncbi:MAG: carboxypeptidase regulatory-like domain-containing protein [Chloroflexi bacterium]|nr:carboxypeptidase regulatory-like domain-containing protein [Chloroflexota bacterium]
MRLQDYPRPPDDNGIGMHWSGGNPGAVGASVLRQRWIPELQRMGVKWVKFLHDGGLDFAEMLLAADIMPVVRLYRFRPNSTDIEKATLSQKEIDYLDEYVARGVRYFEFNNEPELHGEWEGGQVPSGAIDYVTKAAIRDMETILKHGGYPAVPATAISTKWDLIAKIIELGGRHLFDEPVWLALHNYDLNHPLDYPYDDVNQKGLQLSQDEYDLLGHDAWAGGQWGQRSLEFVNQQRQQGANPGNTIHDDPSGFRAYERLGDLCRQHLGRYLPILSTENGPLVGEADDPRYPTTTAATHAEKAVDQAKIIMGTSERYLAAPPHYFCTAFWLMGNTVLLANGWEQHAWFSDTWPGGKLPAVEALAALPKQPRADAQASPTPEQPTHDDPGGTPTGNQGGSIRGTLSGHAHTTVILRSTTYADQTETDAQGAFSFSDVPPGVYRLSVPAASIVRNNITLAAQQQLTLDLADSTSPSPAPAGSWQADIRDAGVSPGFGIIRLSVEGRLHLPVHISAPGWEGYTRQTGSKTEYGPYALEFAPLGAGHYTLQVDEIDAQTEVDLDANQILFVTFRPSAESQPDTQPAANSVIQGQVTQGAGLTIILTGPQSEFDTQVAADESYRFPRLSAGTYSLRIPGTDLRRSGLVMDGSNQRTANFILTPSNEPAAQSVISGSVSNGAGHTLILRGPDIELSQTIGADEQYRFDSLPAGTYRLAIEGTDLRRSGLVMDGQNERTANFTIGQPTQQGMIIGQVHGGAQSQALLRSTDGGEWVQLVGDDEHFRFEGIAAGAYTLTIFTPNADLVRNLQLAPGQTIELDLDATVTVPADPTPKPGNWQFKIEDGGPGPGFAVIRVRIDGQPRLPVRIWTQGWAGMVRQIGEKAEYGEFVCEFAPLGSGDYWIEPDELGVVAQVHADGSRVIWVTFSPESTPAESPPPKTIDHYVLVGALPLDKVSYVTALAYMARFQPAVGTSISEAMRARRVSIWGSELTVTAADAERLQNSGSKVERILPEALGAVLQQRLDVDLPYPA